MEEEYKENFCMCKANFQKLCSQLRPFITQHKTNMRAPIDVETQVTVYLYYISDEGRLRKTANAFGLSRSPVSVIVQRLGKAITKHLGPKYIVMPTTEEEVNDFTTHLWYATMPRCYRLHPW